MEKTIIQADKKKQLLDRHQQLLDVIPYGRENAITVKSIIALIGRKDTEIRATIADMILNYGLKIGSCGRGFYRIQNLKEHRAAVATLASRRNELNRRIRALEEAPTDDQLSIYEVEPEAAR